MWALFALTAFQLFALGDLFLASYLEKKYFWWPTCTFKCFCGVRIELNKVWPPLRTRTFLKARRHTQGCLLWILNVDFNGLTPYFGQSYREDIQDYKPSLPPGVLTPEYFLKSAQKRSRLSRQGKNPFGDED